MPSYYCGQYYVETIKIHTHIICIKNNNDNRKGAPETYHIAQKHKVNRINQQESIGADIKHEIMKELQK